MIPAEGRDARLYSTSSHGDQQQGDNGKRYLRYLQRSYCGYGQQNAAARVDHRDVEDGTEFAQPTVGYDGAKHREKVNEHGEGVIEDFRFGFREFENVREVQNKDCCK